MMNLILKIDDRLAILAQHQAVVRGVPLSEWIAGVIQKELATLVSHAPSSLLEAVGNEALANVELDLE